MHTDRPTRSAVVQAGRAPLLFAFVIALGALVAPAGPAARPILAAVRSATLLADMPDYSPAQAEASLVAMVNADRAAAGLPALRLDAGLSALAHERSNVMAAAGQLSHVQPDGRSVVDLVKADGIAWYGLGETISWNTYPSLRDSTRLVNQGWMGSPEHAAIIRSSSYNYFGLGLARTASGDRYWTAIFLRGPDRTAPWAKMLAPASGSLVTLASRGLARLVRWSWTGDDRPLAVLTSGLGSFEVQCRIDGGAWVTVKASTTSRTWSSSVAVGHRVQVRVRARDSAGNVGSWSAAVWVSA